MKTFKRLLQFAQPIGGFLTPYILLSILGSIFSVANFAMIMPVLDTIFNSLGDSAKPEKLMVLGDFEWYDLTNWKAYGYQFLNQMIAEGGDDAKMKVLYYVCGTTVIFSLLSNLLRYATARLREWMRARTVARIRSSIFDKVVLMDNAFFSSARKGDLMSRATNDVQAVEGAIMHGITTFFKEPIQLIIFFYALFNISTDLTLFAFILIPVSGGAISFIAKKLKRHSKKTQEMAANLLSILDEMIGGMRVVKAFNSESYMKEKYEVENKRYVRSFQKEASRRELASPYSEVMGGVFISILIIKGGSLVLTDASLTGSEFIAYISLFTQVLNPAKAIAGAIGNIQRGLAAGDRILEMLDVEIEIKDKENAKTLEVFDDKVSLENVSFAYEDKKVLKNINLDIPKGKTVALVGPSGGGKSTLSDLIPRFYDPTEGKITIDGEDVKDFTLHSLREKMGIVTQESILFNDTIFNNIAFGTSNASREEVIEAAKIANAHDFIMAMEDGYDTNIGDRGMKLSGGQRQRLSIARAIFKKPQILILDEATSALDTESEKLVQKALEYLMQNCTSLVIAHRLSTIQHADEIVVIKDGEIVEKGTHDHLLLQKGVYHKLQSMQKM
ncbi:ABC transporter ATP-binding protein [Sediminitomix flava]|uniref:ATP-binding cassette, subfamily B, MsbA n=1 Tax=Sediminitomix flava TaxID=379075 RepID=A0A315ZHZ9_SEDFL|nr:ABC transporter ATP-binding protein [Sediminitomix flava]PWJ44354.1 ATP-binding cassette, subfamily B, MsbA [Sediminitomix flava]